MTTESKKYLESWIKGFLSTPHPLLSNFPPCPYAKKALADNKIKFVTSENYITIVENAVTAWEEQYDVLLVICGDVNKDVFVNDVYNLNKKIMPLGFVALEDHIEIPEVLGELDFRNGMYNIVLVQKTSKINEASLKLKEIGYYKNWPTENLESVVNWRFNEPQGSQSP